MNAVSIEIASETLEFEPKTLLFEKFISNSPRCIDEESLDAKTPDILPRMFIDGGTRINKPGRNAKISETDPRYVPATSAATALAKRASKPIKNR